MMFTRTDTRSLICLSPSLVLVLFSQAKIVSCHQTNILNLVPVKITMNEYGLLTFIHLSDTPLLNHNSCDNNCDKIISHPPLLMLLL